MSGINLVVVTDQKTFLLNANVVIEVPEDAEGYTVSSAVYAACLQQLEEVNGAEVSPGTYSVMLTATLARADTSAPEEDDRQLALPLEEE
jgi:hypothetical protein